MALESVIGAEHLAANQSYAQRDAQFKLKNGYKVCVVLWQIYIKKGLRPNRRRPFLNQIGLI